MKILVVDDDETNCHVLNKLLVKDQHEVVIARDGQQSVELFESELPDMVLMDVMMPVMDGYEAASIIKQKSVDTFVPIIFITALENDDALIRCLESGGDDFISKPFKIPILRAKISAMERIRELQLVVDQKNKELLDIQKRNNQELLVAEQIFNKVIATGGVDSDVFCNFHKPAENFSGDLVMAVKSPRGCLNVMLGDFTGHGVAAAMCTLPVVDIFTKMSVKGHGIDSIVKQISYKIKDYLPVERFFATCLISIDWKDKTLKIWNGGMPDVYIYNKDKGMRLVIPSNQLPLGILPADKTECSVGFYQLEEGDKIFAYSDGLIELEVKENEMFGDVRLKSIIERNADANIVELVEEEIAPYADQVGDDITFLEINCDFEKMSQVDAIEAHANKYGNWDFSFKLDVETIRSLDPVPVLLSVLEEMQEFQDRRDSLFTILSEMYSNSLEHGVLGMSSTKKQNSNGFDGYYEEVQERLAKLQEGHIIVNFLHAKQEEGSTLTISMTDSGEGFDVSTLDKQNDSENQLKSGRGLMLIRHLAKECWFNEKGNQFNVSLEWGNF